MKNHLYILLPLLIAMALRLYPYATSGMPFSTDAWTPIRNAELLIEQTPVDLSDDQVFDGYNNYWPANSLFGALFSQVSGIEPKQAMATILPIIGSMAILIFYTLVKRLFNAKISFIASIIFATAFTHAYFTAAVTKETYANPLYLLLILIFLHPTIGKSKQLPLFTITSIALALTHHLTPLIAIAILFGIATAHLLDDAKRGVTPHKFDLLLPSILTMATMLYYLLYAQAGFKLLLTLSDWISAVSYQIITFALATYLISKSQVNTSTRTLLIGTGAAATTFIFTSAAAVIPLVPGWPIIPSHYMIYNFPYVIAMPLITLGYGHIRGSKAIIPPLFWLASIIGLEAYAVFGNSGLSLALSNRALNFLHPPLAILAALGLYRLYGATKKPHLKTFMKLVAIAAILTIASLNSYSLYAAINLEERYMGYHWLYRTQEYKAGAWITTTTTNPTIAGDMKAAYILRDYFQAKVDVLQGYSYLTGNDESQPQILFIYRQMLKNGYVLGFHGVDLPKDWMEKTAQLNLIYSNGLASLYTGEDA